MISKIARNSFWKIIQIIISNISIFVVFFILSNTWDPDKYGLYLLFYSITFFFMYFVVNGLSESTSKYIAESLSNKEIEKKETRSLIITSIIYSIIISLILGIVLFILKDYISKIFNREELTILLKIAPAFIIISCSSAIVESIIKGYQNLKYSTLTFFISRIIQISLLLALIKYQKLEILNVLLITIFGILISVIFGFIIIDYKYLRYIKEQKIYIINTGKRIIKYAIPISITSVTYFLYTRIDIIIIGKYCDNAEVAYFNVADKIFQMPFVVIFTFISAVFAPVITTYFIDGRKEKLQELFTKILSLSIIFVFPTTLLLFVLSDSLIEKLFPQYQASIILLKVLLPLLLIKIFSVCRTFLIATKYAKYTTRIVLFGAAVNVILDLIFIPFYGALGAVIVTVFAQLVVAIFEIYYLRKKLGLKLKINLNIKYIIGIIKSELIK